MTDPTSLSVKDLEMARDLGAVTYLTAYIHLLSLHLGVSEIDKEERNAMAASMVEAVNLGTEAAFRALMSDREGLGDAMKRLQKNLEELFESDIEVS